MLHGIFTGASRERGKYFRCESCHVSGPRLILIFTPLAVMRFTLHGRLHGIFTELHGLRVFYPYPFFTPYPFLPLGEKGALISNGWDAKQRPR